MTATTDVGVTPVTETTEPKKRVNGPKRPYYRAARKITYAGKTYKPGQVVPGAGDHPRVEALVRARHLRLVE
jgi:hypothetical protein